MYGAISVVLLLCVTGIESAKILAYFPTPSISHQVVFRPITRELARRGHEVIVVTPNPEFPEGKSPSNLTEIDVQEVSYKSWKNLLINHSGRKIDIVKQGLAIFERLATILDLQMQTPAVQNMLKDKDKNYFDLLLLEACNRPLLGFANKFEAPVIQISSLGAAPAQFNALGAPSHPLLYPTPGRIRTYNLTLWERGFELIKQWGLDLIFFITEEYDSYVAKKHFGDDTPTFKELRKNIQMLFLNEHPIWSENRPVPPSIKFIGGIHQPVENELPEDLKDYLDSSKHGVIYISFGTNVLPSLLSPEIIEIMKNVFSELPYDILWKWDKDTLPGKSKNIKISSWLPQTDLLRHPNLKLFITQGGLQSTDEAIDAGVPLIGIPMLADQWYNVEKYVHHGIGKQLDITTITEKEFKETIQTVIKDKSYKDNILRLRSLMRSYPIKPLDNVIWWIEHVITYSGSHLQSPASEMSWIEYYEVKLVLVGIAIILSIIVLIGYILKLIFKYVYKIIKTNFKIKIQ